MTQGRALWLIIMPLLDAIRAAGVRTKLDPTVVLVTVGVFLYLAMLALSMTATYALWAGPHQFGIAEPWLLVAYFVVPYLSTLLVGFGITAVVRPEIVRRVLSQ